MKLSFTIFDLILTFSWVEIVLLRKYMPFRWVIIDGQTQFGV